MNHPVLLGISAAFLHLAQQPDELDRLIQNMGVVALPIWATTAVVMSLVPLGVAFLGWRRTPADGTTTNPAKLPPPLRTARVLGRSYEVADTSGVVLEETSDAMTSKRSYRSANSMTQALDRMFAQTADAIDPAVMRVLERVVSQRRSHPVAQGEHALKVGRTLLRENGGRGEGARQEGQGEAPRCDFECHRGNQLYFQFILRSLASDESHAVQGLYHHPPHLSCARLRPLDPGPVDRTAGAASRVHWSEHLRHPGGCRSGMPRLCTAHY